MSWESTPTAGERKRRHQKERVSMQFRAVNVLALCLWFVASAANAQRGTDSASYPHKPVRVIVPVAPGGSIDLIARIVMAKLSETMGGPFVIDNRAGAGGILGNEIVAHAQVDGYTLLFTYAAHTIVPFIYRNIPCGRRKEYCGR